MRYSLGQLFFCHEKNIKLCGQVSNHSVTLTEKDD